MVADVTVVGTGAIGLACALELADRGLTVRIVGTLHAGDATSASGGMLAPSVEPELGPAHDFAIACRDRWPAYAAVLAERSRRPLPVNQLGILEVALDDREAATLQAESNGVWLNDRSLRSLEPGVAGIGAVLHEGDGCVDPLQLLDALRICVAGHERIHAEREDVCDIHVLDTGCNVHTEREGRYASDLVVIAAGAWSGLISGAGDAARAVEPVMGQMIAFDGAPTRHVAYGAGGYVIPKSDGHLVAGSTMEHVGFDAAVSDAVTAMLAERAARLCPGLAARAPVSAWTGLRPMTPDGLPLLGRGDSRPRVIFACGHSRNGILLTPLTAEVVADMATDARPRYDMAPFRPDRFLR